MKIFQNVLVALAMAQDDERKVPPRTPAQRLNTLKRFAGEWINAQIGVEINRPSRAENMINIGIERLESKMTEAASKDCFFFDPTVEHGGPNPASARKRRGTNWVERELSRIQREVDANDDLDIFDRFEEDMMRGVDAQVRLSDDTDLAWKQIGTGFRKWILRYIADCNGQKSYQYHTNRLAKIHGNIQNAYETVGDSQEEDYSEI
jgi:hypothetical protein